MTALVVLKLLATAARAVFLIFSPNSHDFCRWKFIFLLLQEKLKDGTFRITSLPCMTSIYRDTYLCEFSCKGVMMFVVIGMIGSGYSFFKHYLSDRDRKILVLVIPLQILANAAQIEALEGSLGSVAWRVWVRKYFDSS